MANSKRTKITAQAPDLATLATDQIMPAVEAFQTSMATARTGPEIRAAVAPLADLVVEWLVPADCELPPATAKRARTQVHALATAAILRTIGEMMKVR